MSDHDSTSFQFPPAPDLVVPRDDRKILFTKDFHFIARTLETWSDQLSELWEFQPEAEDETAHYYFKDSSGHLYNPLSGTPAEPLDNSKPGQCFTDPASIYRHLTEDFFYLRCLLTQRCKTDLTLCFQGNPLLHAGDPLGPALETLNSQLAHPVDRNNDPILDHLETLSFAASTDRNDLGDHDGKPVCPLDGPVTPLKIGITTPMWTWKAWCGCSWEIHACPGCLGELGSGHLAEG
ncbi:MAG: hypothetical protein DRJ65_17865 [Acidobacteria bacterium]|nr:MAG: hypothetical protein DRJ65_17865 [Acidobacteriota bacterium]